MHKTSNVCGPGLIAEFIFEFGSQGTRPGQFMFPLGIAVTPARNEVVVVDSTNHRVQIIKPEDGSCIGVLKPSGASGRKHAKETLDASCAFQFPVDVAVDNDGNYIVTDKENVQIFDHELNFIKGLRPGGNGNGLRCVAVDRFGVIVLVDNGRNRIQLI
eukprot:c13672_g1_i2.p1 GENE.c13672_g1_i2~~c13672_g1_i2.p1  ORF type:complete len:159 (+),score=38.78 c13672_g1_i2:114-590(+)